MKTRIKICGITRAEDAHRAVELGAHALGFVFYGGSPRCISVTAASAIIKELPPYVTAVALFVNPEPADVIAALVTKAIGVLQFHGDETDNFCCQFGHPYVKALRVAPGVDLLECERTFAGASGLLLDASVPGSFGGTGQTFDWQCIPRDIAKPVILSGGLNPDNVYEAVRQVQPWAVDVSSGVETATKGVKDALKLKAFMSEVCRADV